MIQKNPRTAADLQANLLSSGERTASIVNAARRDDSDAVLAFVRERFGNRGAHFVARGIVAAAKRLDADIPAIRVLDTATQGPFAFAPRIDSASSRRPRIRIDWMPLFSVAEAEVPITA